MPDDKNLLFAKSRIGDMERNLDVLKRAKSDSVSNEELQSSIEGLSRSIEQMMKIFKLATDEIKLEEHDKDTVTQRLEPIMKKLNELTDQNEKIADGVVAVADMLKEHMDKELVEFRAVENRIGQIKMPPMPPPIPPRPTEAAPMNMGFPDFGMPPMPQGMSSPGMMPPAPMDFGMGNNFGQMPPAPRPPEKKKGFLSFGK